MDNTCAHCGKAYSRPKSLIGRFCSKRCAYDARHVTVPARRKVRRQLDHPLAGKTGLLAESRAALFDSIGWGPHNCHWCEKPVNWLVGKSGNAPDALIADHLNGDFRNDSLENLVPSCGVCNATRTQRIKPEEAFAVRANGTRVRAVERVCATCGKVFLIAPSLLNRRANAGLYCSRSCARRAPRRLLPHCPTCTCCQEKTAAPL